MKRFIFACLLLIAASSFVFAQNISLYGVNNDSRCVLSQNGTAVVETFSSISGAKFELSANIVNSEVHYNLMIKNSTNFSYLNNSSFLTVYQGNYDKNSWSQVSYTKDVVTPPPSSVPEASESNDGLSTAEFCIIAGTVCLCSIALWDFCDAITDGPSTTIIPSGPTIWIDPVIELGNGSSSSSSSRNENNSVYYSQTTLPSDYSMSFHTKLGKGPDYRVKINTGSEEFNYYFLRTDRNGNSNTNTNTTTPATTNGNNSIKSSYNSIVASVSLPQINRFGLNYIYSGNPIGLYLGVGFILPPGDLYPDVIGYADDYDYNHISAPYLDTIKAEDVGYRFIDCQYAYDNLLSFNVGMNVKLTDFLWLMGGVGVDFDNGYKYGMIQATSDGVNYTDRQMGYIQDHSISFIPQLGLNIIANHVDIGTLFSYHPTSGFRADVMLGFAF